MKVSVINWSGESVDSMDLSPEVFGVEVRSDILSRVVLWQLAKRRSGNHKTKEIGDVSGTTRKPHRQKGTGRARQGSLRSPQFRKGAVIFGPVVRDHGYSLPKKIRRLGLKCALSSRLLEEKLIVMDQLSCATHKTKNVKALFSQGTTLMIGQESVCENLKRAVSNIHSINLLPRQGINVYDIIRHDRIVVDKAALENIQSWLLT
jgi:large subunit ribosomal protein L4